MANFWDPVLRAFRWKDDTGEAHNRQHDITSVLDHAPVPPIDRGKLVATDPVTGAITFESRFIPEGEKATDTNSGTFGEMSLTDDYLFVCVKTGTAGSAIWKKSPLHQT